MHRIYYNNAVSVLALMHVCFFYFSTMTDTEVDPLFLTYKLQLKKLSAVRNIYDFQLRDHLRTDVNIFHSDKCGKHRHIVDSCNLVTTQSCETNNCNHRLVIPYQALLFHPELEQKKLYSCTCVHVHAPPCNICINCKLFKPCVVKQPYVCNYLSDVTCNNHITPILTQPVHYASHLYEHIYNTKTPFFYMCNEHAHKHMYPSAAMSNIVCYVQSHKCCSEAIYLPEVTNSFIVTTTNTHLLKTTQLNMKFKILDNFTIYDPQIWRGQSRNFVMSFLRGVLNNPSVASIRYKRYQTSNFIVPNIKKYISGKESGVRSSITGFETTGIYQTSTISCTLPRDVVLVPQKLYDFITTTQQYELDMAAIKRDPSIRPTCMFIQKLLRNPDPQNDTLVIGDSIADPMHQDQDGDKNGIYLLKKFTTQHGYKHNESYSYKLAKLEMTKSFGVTKTLTGLPRYAFSEQNLRLMVLKHEELIKSNKLYSRYYMHGFKFLITLGCGYMSQEYNDLCAQLIEYNKRDERNVFSVDDLIGETPLVKALITSGVTNNEAVKLFYKNLSTDKRLSDKKDEMIAQMNKYITSGKELKNNGRKQFSMLYSASDIICVAGNIYYNKIFVYDFRKYPSAVLFAFKEPSLIAFIDDLEFNLVGG